MSASGFGMGRGAIIGVAVAASLCSGALAQDSPALSDAASAMIGVWEFSNADHDKICRFTFRSDAVADSYKLDIDKNCANLFPSTKDIAAWAVDAYGSLRLLDARGSAVIELTEAETGIFDGFQPGEGRYVLQSAAAAPVRSADEMVGDWAVARGTGKPICTLTLANNAAGADGLMLKLKPGCDPLITRFGPTSWRIDQGELVLLSGRGQVWRFEENDPNTWLRVPEGSDPLLLVRQ
ncbi:MAG TPA: AprI/Inh family metalloprotease inhibitor [Xanthobacteraceae bacterium]|nr:AprI/Inh family metalloprotease inhibitor [Xanthobacteraceae bacterium]